MNLSAAFQGESMLEATVVSKRGLHINVIIYFTRVISVTGLHYLKLINISSSVLHLCSGISIEYRITENVLKAS